MASPLPWKQTPLQNYLGVQTPTLAEMNQILGDGAAEAERLIPKLLEQHGVSGKVKAGQLALVLKEIRLMQAALWGALNPALVKGVANAVQAAALGQDILWDYLGRHGVDIPALRDAFVAQAKQGLPAVYAKAANGIPLSSAVYKTQALATGLVNRRVTQGLLLGHGHKRIADSVRDLIRPDVKGGVSYAAHRLARTELNNAFKTAQEARYADEPWTTGMRWNLSKSHPRLDECNLYATEDAHDLGPGVYPVGERPHSHPNCLCYLTPEQVDEDTFVDNFIAGEYNTFIDETVYTHGPKGGRPCA